MGDFEFSDLKLHQQQEIVNAVRKGATRRDIMTWMMLLEQQRQQVELFLGALTRFWQVPKRGGRLVCAGDQHGPADTHFDPILCTASVDYWRGRMFYGNLVRLKADLSWEPELAEEVL